MASLFFIELHTRWMAATLIDFCINIVVIGAWVVYKESSWIIAAVWVVLLAFFGSIKTCGYISELVLWSNFLSFYSIATCGYIVMQFFKLSPEESSKDPLYFVLVRNQQRDVTGHRRGHSVVTARVIFAALGGLMLGTLLYTLIVDGSPFGADVFTPCG